MKTYKAKDIFNKDHLRKESFVLQKDALTMLMTVVEYAIECGVDSEKLHAMLEKDMEH